MTALAALPVRISLDFNQAPLTGLTAALAALSTVVVDGTVTSTNVGLQVNARVPIGDIGPEEAIPTLRIVNLSPAAQINAATAALPTGPPTAAPAESTPGEEPDPEGEKTVCCPDCGRRFSTAHALAVHHGRTHRTKQATPTKPAPASKGVTYRCDDCGREYDQGARLEHHRKVHHTPPATPVHEVAAVGKRYL